MRNHIRVVLLCMAQLMRSVSDADLKDQYNLQTPSDYRAFMNVQGKGFLHDPLKQKLYELAASILGYKPVTLVERSIFPAVLQNKAPEMVQRFITSRPLYAYIEGEVDYIFYGQATRKKALLLIEAMVKDWDIYANMEYHYLLGKCLGYPEKDIKLFIQRRMFEVERGEAPLTRIEFDEFRSAEDPWSPWSLYYELTYQFVKDKVDTYIETQSEDNVEQRINTIAREQGVLIVYDRPSSELMTFDFASFLTNVKRLYDSLHLLHQQIMAIQS